MPPSEEMHESGGDPGTVEEATVCLNLSGNELGTTRGVAKLSQLRLPFCGRRLGAEEEQPRRISEGGGD
eukprot:11517517-Prorocentrum_lima.AAC.1